MDRRRARRGDKGAQDATSVPKDIFGRIVNKRRVKRDAKKVIVDAPVAEAEEEDHEAIEQLQQHNAEFEREAARLALKKRRKGTVAPAQSEDEELGMPDGEDEGIDEDMLHKLLDKEGVLPEDMGDDDDETEIEAEGESLRPQRRIRAPRKPRSQRAPRVKRRQAVPPPMPKSRRGRGGRRMPEQEPPSELDDEEDELALPSDMEDGGRYGESELETDIEGDGDEEDMSEGEGLGPGGTGMDEDEEGEITDNESPEERKERLKEEAEVRKMELLTAIKHEEALGSVFPKNYTIKSSEAEMRAAINVAKYNRKLRTQAKLLRQGLMICIKLIETINTKYSPFGDWIDLQGWSGAVMRNAQDYDAVLMEIVEYHGGEIPFLSNPYLKLGGMLVMSGAGFAMHRASEKAEIERKKKEEKVKWESNLKAPTGINAREFIDKNPGLAENIFDEIAKRNGLHNNRYFQGPPNTNPQQQQPQEPRFPIPNPEISQRPKKQQQQQQVKTTTSAPPPSNPPKFTTTPEPKGKEKEPKPATPSQPIPMETAQPQPKSIPTNIEAMAMLDKDDPKTLPTTQMMDYMDKFIQENEGMNNPSLASAAEPFGKMLDTSKPGRTGWDKPENVRGNSNPIEQLHGESSTSAADEVAQRLASANWAQTIEASVARDVPLSLIPSVRTPEAKGATESAEKETSVIQQMLFPTTREQEVQDAREQEKNVHTALAQAALDTTVPEEVIIPLGEQSKKKKRTSRRKRPVPADNP